MAPCYCPRSISLPAAFSPLLRAQSRRGRFTKHYFYNRRDIFSMARLKHHVPQLKEILPLMKFKMPTLDRRAARLAAGGNVWDIRKIAKRRTPTPAFDYVDGAAQSEITISRSRKYFNDIELIPKILHSTPDVDLSTTIAGGKSSLPFGIAPTGFTRFMHSEGEDAGAASASKAGIPFSLSTMGTRSIEEVARASENAKNTKDGSG